MTDYAQMTNDELFDHCCRSFARNLLIFTAVVATAIIVAVTALAAGG